jgi:hypothetical protein
MIRSENPGALGPADYRAVDAKPTTVRVVNPFG